MKEYDNLITWLTETKTFAEIGRDDFLFSLYQIWDMGFWDDDYDIPLTYKRIVARIGRFLKTKISKTTSWAALSGELQKKFYEYFNNELKRKYLKKDTLYIISNLLVEDERYGSKSKIYEITTKLDTDEDKQTFIDCVKELINLNKCDIANRVENDLTHADIKNLFKDITYHFLHIECQNNHSIDASGKVFIFKLDDNEVYALTGKRTKYMQGVYLKVQFVSSKHTKNGVDDVDGIVSINSIELRVNFISAKNSDRHIYAKHSLTIDSNNSGLPFDIKIKFAELCSDVKKQPTILIKQKNSNIPYLISKTEPHFISNFRIAQHDNKLLKDWVKQNYNIIIKYLQGRVTDKEVLNTIKRV